MPCRNINKLLDLRAVNGSKNRDGCRADGLHVIRSSIDRAYISDQTGFGLQLLIQRVQIRVRKGLLFGDCKPVEHLDALDGRQGAFHIRQHHTEPV
jgi:hypothetical protein